MQQPMRIKIRGNVSHTIEAKKVVVFSSIERLLTSCILPLEAIFKQPYCATLPSEPIEASRPLLLLLD